MTYWYDIQATGQTNTVPEYEANGPTLGEQGSRAEDWNIQANEANWSIEGTTEETTLVDPIETNEYNAIALGITLAIEELIAEAEQDQVARELETIQEVPEPGEGLFQDYLGPEHKNYRHPDSPRSETEELGTEEEVPNSGENQTLIPIPVPNGELRQLGRSRSYSELGTRTSLDRRGSSGPESNALALVRRSNRSTTQLTNQYPTVPSSLVVVQYTDTSSDEAKSEISEEQTESTQVNSENEKEDNHPNEIYGTDSEEEEA